MQYSFYKNIACFTNQLYYAFYTNFSNQTMFDGANLTGYNVAFTALPIFIFGLVGRNLPADRLLELPHLYRRIADNKLLSLPEFLLWFPRESGTPPPSSSAGSPSGRPGGSGPPSLSCGWPSPALEFVFTQT